MHARWSEHQRVREPGEVTKDEGDEKKTVTMCEPREMHVIGREHGECQSREALLAKHRASKQKKSII